MGQPVNVQRFVDVQVPVQVPRAYPVQVQQPVVQQYVQQPVVQQVAYQQPIQQTWAAPVQTAIPYSTAAPIANWGTNFGGFNTGFNTIPYATSAPLVGNNWGFNTGFGGFAAAP